jgi:hypothetical protein
VTGGALPPKSRMREYVLQGETSLWSVKRTFPPSFPQRTEAGTQLQSLASKTTALPSLDVDASTPGIVVPPAPPVPDPVEPARPAPAAPAVLVDPAAPAEPPEDPLDPSPAPPPACDPPPNSVVVLPPQLNDQAIAKRPSQAGTLLMRSIRPRHRRRVEATIAGTSAVDFLGGCTIPGSSLRTDLVVDARRLGIDVSLSW